ncbi:MAG: glycosyltransferase family 2 protein [Proteobacteria bacterium]|nr:glycosyltransferase family 2 protein [Pseudomonadota bacterium]
MRSANLKGHRFGMDSCFLTEIGVQPAGDGTLPEATLMNPELTLLMPAYNEEAALRRFLPQVCNACVQHGWKLIVVDDGSCDTTLGVLQAFAAEHAEWMTEWMTVLRHKRNRGYGAALKTGLAAATTRYVCTLDADGQHDVEDVRRLRNAVAEADADMVVGDRRGNQRGGRYRALGRGLLRFVARFLLPLDVRDLNSGMKLYDTELAQRYAGLCPDSMAFSDVLVMVFISERHVVVEHPIRVRERIAGVSTISTRTAIDTLAEILNVVVLFNPMRLFLPISLTSLLLGVAWGLPIVLRGDGVSVGAMLAIVTGIIFFLLGLLAEQIGLLRRDRRE